MLRDVSSIRARYQSDVNRVIQSQSRSLLSSSSSSSEAAKQCPARFFAFVFPESFVLRLPMSCIMYQPEVEERASFRLVALAHFDVGDYEYVIADARLSRPFARTE